MRRGGLTDCVVCVSDLWNPRFNQPLVKVVIDGEEQTTLTTGMLLLWTLGSSIHTAYNLLQWHIAACACCRAGGMCEKRACCPSLGKQLLRVLVLVIVSMAIIILLTRVAISNSKDEKETRGQATSSPTAAPQDKNIHFFDDDSLEYEVHDASEFEFIVGYAVEMLLAFLVYYPMAGTVLFSGILGCGRIPLLGGRPFEVKAEEQRMLRKNHLGPAATEDDTSDDVEGNGAVVVEHIRSPRL